MKIFKTKEEKMKDFFKELTIVIIMMLIIMIEK